MGTRRLKINKKKLEKENGQRKEEYRETLHELTKPIAIGITAWVVLEILVSLLPDNVNGLYANCGLAALSTVAYVFRMASLMIINKNIKEATEIIKEFRKYMFNKAVNVLNKFNTAMVNVGLNITLLLGFFVKITGLFINVYAKSFDATDKVLVHVGKILDTASEVDMCVMMVFVVSMFTLTIFSEMTGVTDYLTSKKK